jgi:hypothetical protein
MRCRRFGLSPTTTADRKTVGYLLNPTKAAGGTFTILQDTPPLTSDAQSIYALNFTLPANSLGNDSGILVITSNENYSFAAGAANFNYGLVMYNTGDAYTASNLIGLISPNTAYNGHVFMNAVVYLDSTGTLVFLEACSLFNSSTTPNKTGGSGSGNSQIASPPNTSGLLNFTLPITVQLAFSSSANTPPINAPSYLNGYARAILVT